MIVMNYFEAFHRKEFDFKARGSSFGQLKGHACNSQSNPQIHTS